MELAIGLGGILVSVALYFAGVRQGKRQEREQRDHELALESGRREHEREQERLRQHHERQLEIERAQRELVSKLVDEYVGMSRRRYDSGPHALATLGLEQLGTDSLVREALTEMGVRAGEDVWSGYGAEVDDVDLVVFFRYVRENRVDFFHRSVHDVAETVRQQGGTRTARSAPDPPHAV